MKNIPQVRCVYNAAGQVITRTDVRVSDGTVLHEYHYEYDARGNITRVTGIDGITEAGNAVSVSGAGSVSAAENTDGLELNTGAGATVREIYIQTLPLPEQEQTQPPKPHRHRQRHSPCPGRRWNMMQTTAL